MNRSEYGKAILRIGISLVVLWFGITQLRNPQPWTGLIPGFLTSLYSAKTFVLVNGTFEVLFGLMLFLGVFIRFTSFILFLHIMSIAVILGYNPIGVRDFGLALGSLAIFFNGKDKFSLSKLFR